MNVFIVGISGKMGRALIETAPKYGMTVTGGLDKAKAKDYPTFTAASDVSVPVDVVIDFSHPETLDSVIELCEKFKCPCVLATTGYDKSQEDDIATLARKVPVFKSANMSLGINVLSLLAERAAALLEGFDIEVIERHHNQKADAPSGTAKLLCKSIEKGLGSHPEYVYGREGNCKRTTGEIGVHAVRGGTIVGEHEISYCGAHEVVTLTHSAESRGVFADGALKAANWLMGKAPGLYDMSDMLNLKL